MGTVSESDLHDVVRLLGPDDLHKLYQALSISHHDVQKAEQSADTTDVDLKALSVLRWWKKVKGKLATRETILQALEQCQNVDAKEKLESMWNSKEPASACSVPKSQTNIGGNQSTIFGNQINVHRGNQTNVSSIPTDSVHSNVNQNQTNVSSNQTTIIDNQSNVSGNQTIVYGPQINVAGDLILHADECFNGSAKRRKVDDMPTTSRQTQDRFGCDFNVQEVRRQLMQEYKETRGKLPLLPGMPEECANMEDLFVDLTIVEEDKKPTGVKPRKLESYGELVSIKKSKYEKDKDGKGSSAEEFEIVKRLLVKGNPGAGKSTTVSKLAYDWACDEQASPISKYQLVFVITINEINKDADLIDIIKDQLLPKVSKQGLETYIQSNASSVVFLFDGYDEASQYFKKCKDMQSVLCSKWLQEACVIVTTRPNQVADFCQKYGSYTQVVVTGFSEVSVNKYVARFFRFANLPEEGVSNLLRTLRQSTQLRQLSATPIILSMLCLLWDRDKKFPLGMTALYKDLIMHLANHKYAKDNMCELDTESIEVCVQEVLHRVGKVAIEGLFDDRLVFKASSFDAEQLEEACLLGVVTKERKRSGVRIANVVTFLHKTLQEMCAAAYWCEIVETDREAFDSYLGKIASSDDILKMEYLLRFTCGMSVKAAETILPHIITIVSPFFNDDIRSGNYLPIVPLILLHENESNSSVGIGNAPELHRFLRPLYDPIRIDIVVEMSEIHTEDVMAILDSYIDYHQDTSANGAPKQSWLSEVKEATVTYDDILLGSMGVEFEEQAIGLLCSMSNLSVLHIPGDFSCELGIHDMTPFFSRLIEKQFTGEFLAELECENLIADSSVFSLLLSRLPVLTQLILRNVVIEGTIFNFPCRTLRKFHCSEFNDLDLFLESIFNMFIMAGSELEQQNKTQTHTNSLSVLPQTSLPLEKLMLSEVRQRQFSVHTLVKVIKYMPHLKCLALPMVNMNASEYEELFDGLIEASESKNENKKNTGGLDAAASMACGFALEELDLSGSRSLCNSVGELAQLYMYMPSLKCLDLGFSRMKAIQCEKLLDGFVDAGKKIQEQNGIVTNVSSNVSGASHVVGLHMEKLNLCCNEIGDSVGKLAEAYGYMPQLKVLDLSDTHMNPSQCAVLFDAFIEEGQRLEKQNERGKQGDRSDASQRGLSIEELRLDKNDIGESVGKLAQAYKYMPQLRCLELNDTQMNPSQCAILFDAFIEIGQRSKQENQRQSNTQGERTCVSHDRLKLAELLLANNQIGRSFDKLCQVVEYLSPSCHINVWDCGLNPDHKNKLDQLIEDKK